MKSMVDPGGEERVGAGGIGSDGTRGSGRCAVGSMVAIGFGSGIGSGLDQKEKNKGNEEEQFYMYKTASREGNVVVFFL